MQNFLLYESSNGIIVRQIDYKTDIDDIIDILNNLSEKDKEFTALCFEKKRNFVIEYAKKNQGLVAILDNKIVGVLIYVSYSGSRFTMMDEIVVSQKYRNMGVGKKLINKFHKVFKHTIAITHKDNNTMSNILKKNGYEKLLENPYQGTIQWIRIK